MIVHEGQEHASAHDCAPSCFRGLHLTEWSPIKAFQLELLPYLIDYPQL